MTLKTYFKYHILFYIVGIFLGLGFGWTYYNNREIFFLIYGAIIELLSIVGLILTIHFKCYYNK